MLRRDFMDRRTFLETGMCLGASFLVGCQPKDKSQQQKETMHHQDHSSHAAANQDDKKNIAVPYTYQSPLLEREKFPSHQPLQPLKPLLNQSNTTNSFEANIEVKPHTLSLVPSLQTEFFLYNGILAGPQIVVNEGDTVKIKVTNRLTQPTTIHWHGLPVPSKQDGNPQDAIEPYGSRVYQFKLPSGSAGTYWYHSHAHGLTSEQTYKGLAGSFIVKSKDDPLRDLPEQHWLISDLRLDENGNIPENTALDWMNGREGNFVLINGQLEPKITIKGTERIRIWNACNARYLRLKILDCKIIVIGSDGGLLESPQNQEELFLSPGERYEIIVETSTKRNTHLVLLPYNREKMMQAFEPETITLAEVTVSPLDKPIPQKLRELPPLETPQETKHIVYTEVMNHSEGHGHDDMQGMSAMSMQDLQNMFLINGKTYDMGRMDLTSKVNVPEKWVIKNDSHMDHNFHLHGTQFYVLSHELNGKVSKPDYKSLKDTINLKPYETVSIICKQQLTGIRLFHCHVLEHENLGMMAQLNVLE